MTVLTMNEKLNGIEVKFDSKPARETLDTLKGAGFRWSSRQGFWYAKNTPERLQVAEAIADGKKAEPAKAAQKTDRQKELKAEYNEIIKKEIYPGDDDMQKFMDKNAGYIVELSNKKIVALDRPRIETHFCFSYGFCGVSTVEEERSAAEMAHTAATDADYFKEQNLRQVTEDIEELQKCLDSYYECYTYTSYDRQPAESKLKSYRISKPWENPENDPAQWSNLSDVQKLDAADIQALIDGLKEVEKSFEKRLNTYIKKYGTSKLKTWSFLSD